MTADLDSTRSAAVDHGYHWQPMATCPKGSKVQCASISHSKTSRASQHWSPVLNVRDKFIATLIVK